MNFDFYFYWKLLLRRLPIMALLITLSTALATFVAMRLPESYVTSARLAVEEPQIPNRMVATTVQAGAEEQLDIIQQRLLTRANLIDIANRYQVYEDLSRVDPDEIVDRMKQHTRIQRSSSRNSAILMTITFRGRSGEIVANVVNEYVTLVLEANSDFRVSRAENTLDFFRQEVQRLGEELDAQSVRIATFKSENSEALPENQSYRLGRQSLLQERLSQLERDRRAAESQRNDMQRIFDSTGALSQVGTSAAQQRMTPEQQQLMVARTDLEMALTTYTAQNPRVIRLQSMVDRLEAIVANQDAAAIELTEGAEEGMTTEEALFQATITEIDNRINALTTEIERTTEELEAIQRAISLSSANGIQLSALERDYEILQVQYNAAVSNMNEAQVSERVETTSQGQRVSVIENANVPRTPSGPDRPRIVAMGAAFGLAMAGGFFMLLEFLNHTIRRPAEIESRFNITPLMAIPYMESRSRRLVRRLFLIVGTLVALIGGPLILWYIDTNYMPLDLLVQQVLARLNII